MDGSSSGLTVEDMAKSVATLTRLANDIGADISKLREHPENGGIVWSVNEHPRTIFRKYVRVN